MSIFMAIVLALALTAEAGTWKEDVVQELTGSDPLLEAYDCNYLNSTVCPPLLKNYCCPGQPNELSHPKIHNTLDITLAVSADMQLEVTGCDDGRLNEDKFQNTKDMVYGINTWCRDNGCVAVLAPGDLTQHTCVQELIAFRQLYEHDYPGIDGGAIKGADDDDYDCYGGGGARINYPVFPILGNHDDPSEIKMECDHYWDYLWNKWIHSQADAASNWCSWGEVCHRSYVGDYIEDRLGDDIYYRAADDVSGYNNGNYAFELG
ncbi:MAG: metallophosphoesterase, partial [Deltaproteobacteria bacterium]|nr:metallophosphoesterase [Deltaproteobacteria bacterium]